ncbi:MAG TPA: COG1361 S-layer family protein [Candidatus Nanoarchaeia archaeon]|nr:COG1361 S-layer family protein [Candidatus Nanoarchaeia archaeon]
MEKLSGENMKRILLVVLIGLAAAVSAYGTTTVPSTSYKINISLVNQEPDPVEPGGIVEVRFKVENAGADKANNILVELLPKYPFSILPGDSAQRSIGSLQARQVGENGVIVKYKLKVDESAVEGENDLTLRYKIDSGGWITPKDFSIAIRTFDSILYVVDVDSVPRAISPGGVGKITIKYKNLADSLIRNVKTKIDLSSVPFAPVQSSNVKVIEEIPALSSAEVEFSVMAEAGAQSKAYKIPLELSYNDELNTRYATNDTIGLVIGGVPELAINIEESEIVRSGTSGKIVIKFVNRGPVDIKFMNIRLEDKDNVKVIGPKEAYIGNIDSDDFETEEFNIYVENGESVAIPFEISYKDANNNDYSEKMELPITVYSASEAQKYGLANGNSSIGIFIAFLIVALGVGGYLYYKRKKK